MCVCVWSFVRVSLCKMSVRKEEKSKREKKTETDHLHAVFLLQNARCQSRMSTIQFITLKPGITNISNVIDYFNFETYFNSNLDSLLFKKVFFLIIYSKIYYRHGYWNLDSKLILYLPSVVLTYCSLFNTYFLYLGQVKIKARIWHFLRFGISRSVIVSITFN